MGARSECICLLGLIAVALSGCASADGSAAQHQTIQPLPIHEHVAGDDLNIAELVVLVNDRAQLDALGHYGLSALNVNLKRQSILIIALGEKPTTGWWVRIDGVQRHGSDLYFQGVANTPGKTQLVGQKLTYPYAAAVIPKVDTVQFHPEIESVEGKVPNVR